MDALVLLRFNARTYLMDLQDIRQQLLTTVMDAIEVMTGEELLTIVTRNEDGTLTPWVFSELDELLADKLNGWMDRTPWNSPKSL